MAPTTPGSLRIGDKVYFEPEFMDRLREEINPNIDISLSRFPFTVIHKDNKTRTVTFKSAYRNQGRPDLEKEKEFTWTYDDPIIKSEEDRYNIQSILRDIRRICRCVHKETEKSLDHNYMEGVDVFSGMAKEVQDIMRDYLNSIHHDEIDRWNEGKGKSQKELQLHRDYLSNFKMFVGAIGWVMIGEHKKGYLGYKYQQPSGEDIMMSMMNFGRIKR
jgi:hypothetical protein